MPSPSLRLETSRITDRGASSAAAGPSAVKWGFMCPLAARHRERLFAANFTRPPGVPWNATEPNETPVALWKRDEGGRWESVYLDSPERTYQTPTLLLGPDGRANVFTLHPGSGRLFWFAADSPRNERLALREIDAKWGAYMGGAIDRHGQALLVYWGNGAGDPSLTGRAQMEDGYRKSTIGYTFLDTRSGRHRNGVIDTPGAPYCYSHVEYASTGAHVLTVRSEVMTFKIAGSVNHYTDLRYYFCPDPARGAPWRHVSLYANPKGQVQPIGLEVDPDGRVHALYIFIEERAEGLRTPLQLYYAASIEPIGGDAPLRFARKRLAVNRDGRLYQTRDGRIHLLAYQSGQLLEYARLLDGVAGRWTPWANVETPTPHVRFFPVGKRSGSTLTDDLEGVLLGQPGTPHESSMYHFRLRPDGG